MSYRYGINRKHEFTKDGHTMFNADVLRDLERKEWLEKELEAKNKELAQLKEDAGISEIELNHTKRLLDSCEKALAECQLKVLEMNK